jgi:hypothetical protein
MRLESAYDHIEEIFYIEFEVLRPVIAESTFFWFVTLCISVDHRRFGRTHFLYIQCVRIRLASNQQNEGSKQSSARLGLAYFSTPTREAVCFPELPDQTE